MTAVDELSLQCMLCHKDIPLNLKVEHEKFHRALYALKYTKVGKTPQNVDALLKRRKQLLRRIVTRYETTSDDIKLIKQIMSLDEAFDVARSDLVREQTIAATLVPLIEKVHPRDGGLHFTDKDIRNEVKSGPVWGKLPECTMGMGTTHAQNIQHRDVMEDRITTYPQFVSLDRKKTKLDTFFVGLYDGYHGQHAAELTQLYLHNFIKQEIENEKKSVAEPPSVLIESRSSDTAPRVANVTPSVEASPRAEEGGMITESFSPDQPGVSKSEGSLLSSYSVLRACRNGYKRMDDYLSWGINETSKVRWSACSVATCIVTDEIEQPAKDTQADQDQSVEKDLSDSIGRIYIANAGNVEAYMCHKNKPFALTQRHTTTNVKECRRVEKMGGTIVQNKNNIYVNGVVTITRSLGNHGDVPLRKCVVYDPYTSTARITGHTQYVVIATASVWSVFTVDEVFSLINGTEEYLQKLKEAQKEAAADKVEKPPTRLNDPYLDKIEELEEELNDKIEDVIIVNPVDDEDDDDDDAAPRGTQTEYTRNRMSTVEDILLNQQKVEEDKRRMAENDFTVHQASLAGFAYKNWLAAAMSNRLVRAAIRAGASDNVSAVVILFQGYFHGRDIDFSFMDPAQVDRYFN